MDQKIADRISTIDRLVEMLTDEKKYLLESNSGGHENDEKLRLIADAIVSSEFNRESIQSDKWAGNIVMSAMFGRIRIDANSKQEAQKMLKEIMAAGHLKIKYEYSTRRGRGLPVYVKRDASHS